LTLSYWSFTNYPGQDIFPPLAAQANFWRTGQGRASFDQQHKYQKISSLMSKFTGIRLQNEEKLFGFFIPGDAAHQSQGSFG